LKTIAKNGPDFDEEPLKLRAASLTARRQEVYLALEEQMKLSQKFYEHLDSKITYFGKRAFECVT
jgi:hypothetical protein